MVDGDSLAVLDGVNVNGHDLEAFAAWRHAKQRAHRRATGFAAHDDAVAGVSARRLV